MKINYPDLPNRIHAIRGVIRFREPGSWIRINGEDFRAGPDLIPEYETPDGPDFGVEAGSPIGLVMTELCNHLVEVIPENGNWGREP